MRKSHTLTSDIQDIYLTGLEALFLEWCAPDWLLEHESEIFTNIVEKIKQLTPQLHEITQVQLQFIDQYLHHDNWKLRVCALIFLTKLGLSPPLLERFWLTFNDSHPRVVGFLMRLLIQLFEPLFDCNNMIFETIPLRAPQLRSFDIDRLVQQLPSIHPEVRTEYFWRLVCYLTTRIHLGDGPQLKPHLHELIEIALQKDSFVEQSLAAYFFPLDPYQEGHGLELLFELLRLSWRIPPPPLERRWLQEGLRLFAKFAKGEEYNTECYESYEHDGFECGWPDPVINDLGLAILQTHDIALLCDLVSSYQEPFTHKREYPDYLDPQLNRAAYLLFPRALDLKWQEGVHFLLIDFINHLGNDEESTDILVDFLKQYLSTGAPVTQDLLEALFSHYEYLERERTLLPNALREQLIQIGQHLFQTRNDAGQTYCVTNQFFPPLLGILNGICTTYSPEGIPPFAAVEVARNTQTAIFSLLETILEKYKTLWWDTPHPITLYAPSYEDETAFPRNSLLQLLAGFFLKPIKQKEVWGATLSRLYQAHGIWVPRLLVDVLYVTFADTYDWLTCFTTIGSMWNHSHIPLPKDTACDEEDDWAMLVLHGCSAHPSAQGSLLQYAEEQSHPLPRRELALFVQACYKDKVIESLLPLYKWAPQSLRVVAAEIFGLLRDPRTVPALIDATRETLAKLRAQSAWALGRLQDPRALEPLLAIFVDPEPKVRLAAIRALGALENPDAIPALREQWELLAEQVGKIDTLCASIRGIMGSLGASPILMQIILWRETAIAVREALQKLNVDLPPLTERESLHRIGLATSPQEQATSPIKPWNWPNPKEDSITGNE